MQSVVNLVSAWLALMGGPQSEREFHRQGVSYRAPAGAAGRQVPGCESSLGWQTDGARRSPALSSLPKAARETQELRCSGHNGSQPFPQFDPVAIQIGPLAVHWYGLTDLGAFGLFLVLANLRLRHEPFASVRGTGAWSRRDVEDILFYGVVGVIAGGRLGYCLFYKPAYYGSHPLEIFCIWQGGMSFHGGTLGVIVSQWWFARTRGKPFWQVTDFVAPCVPTGLAAGRLGNFINGELWGRAADPSLPWAMVFPHSGSLVPRHPSQVYQFLMEGLLLFGLLWLYARRERRPAQVSAMFLIGYGVFRFIAEFFREPDAHLGLLSLGMSMGQWLCVPMVLGGVLLWLSAGRQPAAQPASAR